MDRARTKLRRILGLLAPVAVMAACGCQTVRTPENQIAQTNLSRELNKTSLPEYVIEPPDLLVVEVLEALPGRGIIGERLVRPDGTITLGYYGDVYVSGLTLREAKEKIVIHMRKFVSDEVLGLVREEDGKVTEVAPADSDRVTVDVAAYNSKVYYVLGDVAAPGRMPITGNETVLDAIQYAGGLIPEAAVLNIRLVRPAPPGSCCAQLLPVNLPAIMQAGDTTTNYQLMPGDRIFVYRDPIVRGTILLTRLSAPFQVVMQNILQYSFTARSIKSIGVPLFGAGNTNNVNVNTSNTGTATNTGAQ